MKRLLVLTVVLSIASPLRGDVAAQLTTTNHPTLSRDASALWLVPSEKERLRLAETHDQLADAVEKFAAADYAGALPLATRAAAVAGPLQDYARLYLGLSQLRLGRIEDGRRTLDALRETKAQGYLTVAAALASGEAAETAADFAAAVAIYDALASDRAAFDEEILMRLGRAALAAGDRTKAAAAYHRVYYELPLSDSASIAAERLETLKEHVVRSGYKADFNRASILFGARRYTDARAAFQGVVTETSGDDRELADLRIAESDFYLRRYEAASNVLKPYLESASRKAEARFFYLSALREIGRDEEYIALTQRTRDRVSRQLLVRGGAQQPRHVLHPRERGRDGGADLRASCITKFPDGARCGTRGMEVRVVELQERRLRETVRVFEERGGDIPALGLPAVLPLLGGAGPRQARIAAPKPSTGCAWSTPTTRNWYYGRLAREQLRRAGPHCRRRQRRLRFASAGLQRRLRDPPTDAPIRHCSAPACTTTRSSELRYAQRAWGGIPGARCDDRVGISSARASCGARSR